MATEGEISVALNMNPMYQMLGLIFVGVVLGVFAVITIGALLLRNWADQKLEGKRWPKWPR